MIRTQLRNLLFTFGFLIPGGQALAMPMLSVSGLDTVTQGDGAVEYELNLSGVSPETIGGLTVVLGFDTAAMGFTGYTAGDLVQVSDPPNPSFDDSFSVGIAPGDPGKVTIQLTKGLFTGGITSDGSLATLSFDVLDTAPSAMTFLFDTANTIIIDFSTLAQITYGTQAPPLTVTINPVADAPVPAPAPWLLLLGGLAVMRGIARRVPV